MSSIVSFKKYKIVLFQGGLADDGSGLDKTMTLLTNASSNFLRFPKKIDMSNFNPSQNSFYENTTGYYVKSIKALSDFKTLIANIVSFAMDNEGKTILVGTYLNKGYKTNHNLDSIENQKIKLVYIVDEIKNYPNIELSLVGHSQGGLVNLETAIVRSGKIKRLVSISTPYDPVYLGEKLIFIDFFFKIGKQTAYTYFVEDPKNVPAYKKCVEQLFSNSYFADLKKRWDNLISRPLLFVITGTAGHIYKIIPGMHTIYNYVPDTIIKESFDGLVKLSEQTSINHAKFIHLVENDVPCFSDKSFAKAVCYYQDGYSMTCTKSCTLCSLNIGGAIIDVFFNLIDKAIKGEKIQEFAEYKVSKAIFSGLEKKRANVPDGYMNYYLIYANEYNHNFLRYNLETIGHLLALLN